MEIILILGAAVVGWWGRGKAAKANQGLAKYDY